MERLTLSGEIDVAAVDDLYPELLARINDGDGSPNIEIDCSQLTFIDAAGMAMLVNIRSRTGKQVVLRNVSTACRRPFELTHLDEELELR